MAKVRSLSDDVNSILAFATSSHFFPSPKSSFRMPFVKCASLDHRGKAFTLPQNGDNDEKSTDRAKC